MIAADPLQDSGPADSRLLAGLLQAGTLLIDEEDRLRFASTGACELMGVRDFAALREHWHGLAAQLRIDRWPRALLDLQMFHGRADLATPSGPRAIRFELHAVDDGGRVHRAILVRDRTQLLPSDRALLLASEAQANRQVLTGLVHAAKGPLNNFNLTLALLSAGLARDGASPATPEANARRSRYVEVLQNESARLAACIDEIHALTIGRDESREAIDLCAIARDCARVLRHGATMREVALELDVPQRVVTAFGDPQLVRLALLSFTICVLELTSAGGRVGWRVGTGNGGHTALIGITTSEPKVPPALARAIFRLSCTAESEYSAAIAARLIVEAQGGDVVVHDNDVSAPGIALHLPSRA
ncbi:MAG TPA: hypothetical protein VN858_10480 [Casimicrobiaceae bacterium]|nr:hypothetical protein [Casimicrobiaceae bacterium]